LTDAQIAALVVRDDKTTEATETRRSDVKNASGL